MLRAACLSVCLGLGTVPAAGVLPELTHAQRVQLGTADDTRPPDEPAWYGLLANVAEWPPGEAAEGLVPGATVPEYPALLADPASARGGLFVVEGRYAGRERMIEPLRSGAWGAALKEWGLVVDPGPGGGAERVVVVYLVDPGGRLEPPREGAAVRLAGRFYKLWVDTDADGRSRTYPVFVGRSAGVVSAESGAVTSGGAVIVGAIVALLAALFWVRRLGKGGAAARERVGRRLREDADRHGDDTDPQVADLPDDPAAALERLAE